MPYVRVAVPVPLGRAFTYSVPEERNVGVEPGARVLVEFGRRKVLGVVLEVGVPVPQGLSPDKIKPILACIDNEPTLPHELLRFLTELADYYLAPIGEVMRLALPAVSRAEVQSGQTNLLAGSGVHTVGRMVQFAQLSESGEPPADALQKLRGQALDIHRELRETGALRVSELEQRYKNARAAVKRLVSLGFVELKQRALEQDRFAANGIERDVPKELSAPQAQAVSAIAGALSTGPGTPFLLDGVTGSGKTEVYLWSVDACLKAGRGAIVLVPEIALTPQLAGRFRARFGDQIAVLHSGLPEGARHAMWRKLRLGEFRVAVGARSALFAPVQELALICVDEEHDGSFKQEEGVRYHARDMALLRAHRAKAVCVLGSATPSLASESLVRQERMRRLVLPERVTASAKLPATEVINLRHVGPGPTGNRLLSLPLHRALEDTLAAGQQAILFLNRRGFAPSMICDSCGEVVQCPNCAVALTVHRSRGEQLRCHYCDYVAALEQACAKCRGRRLSLVGVGTERVEHSLTEAFPGARVARLDRDVAEGAKGEQVLERMRNGELDILVGTQMVTKGHDLPNVTLVGVLNADAALSLPDFQAAERTFHLLVQVAGRAGRGDVAGRVLVQTRQPDHPAIRFALRHDSRGFVEWELAERKAAHYPPYRRLLMVRVDSLDDRAAGAAVQQAAAAARAAAGESAELLGPTRAPIERLRNRFRHRFMMRSIRRPPLYQAAHAVLSLKQDRRVRVHVDIDPVSML